MKLSPESIVKLIEYKLDASSRLLRESMKLNKRLGHDLGKQKLKKKK